MKTYNEECCCDLHFSVVIFPQMALLEFSIFHEIFKLIKHSVAKNNEGNIRIHFGPMEPMCCNQQKMKYSAASGKPFCRKFRGKGHQGIAVLLHFVPLLQILPRIDRVHYPAVESRKSLRPNSVLSFIVLRVLHLDTVVAVKFLSRNNSGRRYYLANEGQMKKSVPATSRCFHS